jgi:ribosomal protein L29
MDFKDLNRKLDKELHEDLAEQRDALRDLRFRASENQLKNVRAIRLARKAVAQILTALSSRKKGK